MCLFVKVSSLGLCYCCCRSVSCEAVGPPVVFFFIFLFFFIQVQTPVTLCDGELWSILVVRLAHSADLIMRSRLRHVSSAPSVSSRLDKFENTLESTVSRVNAVEASTSKSGKDITTVQAQTKALQTTVMELRKEMADLRASHRDAIADVARKQDVAERMANIIISGLPESKDEDTKQAVNHLFTDTLKVTSNIVSARRLPDPRTTSKNTNRPRLVHVRLGSIDDKLRVVRARSQLKGTTIFLNEDLTKPEQEQKKRLLPKLKALQAKNIKSVHFRRAVLYFQKQPLTDTKMEELLQTPGSSDCMDSSTQKTPTPASDRMETSNSTSAR